MALRVVNNPTTDATILGVLKSLLPVDFVTLQPNTVIGQNQVALNTSLIYVQSKYQMSLGAFPAVHLSSGAQHYVRNSRSTYMGLFVAEVCYYDRWDKQDATIDAIWAEICLDLERMKSNLEDNESLAYGGTAYAISIPEMMLSPYENKQEEDVFGVYCLRRDLAVHINILPYDNPN